MKEPKRDEKGKIIDGPLAKLKSWWLGKQIRSGRLPRGRKITSDEAFKAIGNTHKGYVPEMWGLLSLRVIRANGDIDDLGVVCTKKVVVAFRDYIVDSLQDSTTNPMDAFTWHASGTDNTAEDNTQTALIAEVESRVDGTGIEGAAADIYKTVATVTYTATRSIVEHGVLSASSAGTLMLSSALVLI